YVSNRAAIFDMSEPGVIEIARGWLARCLQEHSSCLSPSRSQNLPNGQPIRLVQVDVPEKDHIQLVQTSDVRRQVEYIALSYCWGGDQLGKTFRSNIGRRRRPFSLFGQAKAVRDAVLVTRSLGLSYLWIDSLCIIQDDEKDLATELSRMGDIYETAALTLSAAKSRTSAEGFLTSSNTCGYRCPDGQVGLIQLQDPKEHIYPEPIHRRCWTLQEHLLSSRVLVFGDTGLRWRCRMANWFDGPWGESDFKLEYVEKSCVLTNPAWDNVFSHDSHGATRVLREWRYLIESSYTQRHVTNPADRLPAISALAARFNRVIPGRYLAGMWEAILPLELLWEAWHHRPDHWPAVGCDQMLPFPSWSWASMATGAGISIEWWQTYVPTIITLECEDIHLSLQDAEFPYGYVKQGTLKLTGQLMEVSCISSGKDVAIFEPEEGLSWPENTSDWNAAFVPKLNTSADTSVICPVIYGLLDELPPSPELDNFFCLEILRRDTDGFEKSWLPSAGLILTRLVGLVDPEGNLISNMFIRIGRFEGAPPGDDNWERPDESVRGPGSPIFSMFEMFASRSDVFLV
ncbi:heterokaryon incompatibility protein-domain-containing protein, partial [Leptodontidium sp. MPI-SDFR-AT-0119]